MNIFPIAEALAADLAGAQVDPNEAQKALGYLRSKRDGTAFFKYLDTIVNNGKIVIRSGRTLDYYRELQRACVRHLRPLQNNYQDLVMAFAWSLRLLRYYRAVPDAQSMQMARGAQSQPASQQQGRPAPSPTKPAVESQPATSQLPAVGATFLGKVLEVDESAVVVEIPGFGAEQAIGVIKSDDLAGKRFAKGNMARVVVIGTRTLQNKRTIIVELQPAPKKT